MSTSPNDRKIDYIEFATRDVAAAKAFYTAAFGWAFTDYGPDYTSFNDGRLSGGFFTTPGAPAATTPPGVSPSNPMVILFAADLEDAAARVAAAGGKIVKPSFEFPGGRRFEFTDPNGLTLAVWSDVRADGTRIG
jgi:predicted enzyme related to lactoylglutathione lyase